MRLLKTILALALVAISLSSCTSAKPKVANKPETQVETTTLPTPIAECSETEIAGKFFRLWDINDPEIPVEEDAIGKEIVLKLTDGMFLYTDQIGDRFLASANFSVGNPVQLCLVSLPTDCPPGDERGKEYSLLDRRTGFSGVYVDSWHLCGGA